MDNQTNQYVPDGHIEKEKKHKPELGHQHRRTSQVLPAQMFHSAAL